MKMRAPRAAVAREAPAAFELSVHQLAVGFGAARPCDYHDEGAHRGEKDDDVDVESVAHELNGVFKGVDKGVLTHGDGVNESAREDSQNRGGDDLFCDEGESDGDDWGQNGKPAHIYR